jgi:VIT1/CCC1 family predicted Fe2+/Mn2+ transporter
MSLEQKKTAINQPSSVENQTSATDKLERTEDAAERVEETPKTVKGQLAELVKAISTTDTESRDFLLRVVQPGLAGLMDGSVSTLAPIFATAFATHQPFYAFLVGMAAATGAGISMAFSEALSDNGELTGRGSPVVRGGITGFMTFFGGSLHTLPFLIANLHAALVVAYVVVAFELVLIAAIRHRFFGTSWWLSIVQVVGGGALVFVAALLFGNA